MMLRPSHSDDTIIPAPYVGRKLNSPHMAFTDASPRVPSGLGRSHDVRRRNSLPSANPRRESALCTLAGDGMSTIETREMFIFPSTPALSDAISRSPHSTAESGTTAPTSNRFGRDLASRNHRKSPTRAPRKVADVRPIATFPDDRMRAIWVPPMRRTYSTGPTTVAIGIRQPGDCFIRSFEPR